MDFYGKIPEIKIPGLKILDTVGACRWEARGHFNKNLPVSASLKNLIMYAQRRPVYCGLCLPSTVNWARWTMNSIYCGPSLPYAGIHQDLGYRHLRPTKNTKIISTEPNIGVFHLRFFSWIAHNQALTRTGLIKYMWSHFSM